MLTFYQISDVIGNTTCKEDFQKFKNARQYYINFIDYLTTSYLNITNNKTYKTFSCAISLTAFLLLLVGIHYTMQNLSVAIEKETIMILSPNHVKLL